MYPMPLVGTPWRVGSRVNEHLSFIMDSSSLEKPDSRPTTSAKRQFGESEVDSPDYDKEGKNARCSSPCSDKYFVLSAADGSSL